MKRRGFLKLLALLPFAPALAEAAAKTIKKPTIDLANGSDQTSIWFVEWGNPPTCVRNAFSREDWLPIKAKRFI